MKNCLNYFYNIDVEEINDDVIIDRNNNHYFYTFLNEKDISNITYVYEIIKKIPLNKLPFYQFVMNRNLEIFTTLDSGKIVVLIKLDNDYNNVIDFSLFEEYLRASEGVIKTEMNIVLKWSGLWEKKINILYNYVLDNSYTYSNYMKIFYYYMGIAESALVYLKQNNLQTYKLSFSHERIFYPVIKKDLFNPTLFILDSRFRDIAGFIKSQMIHGENYAEDLIYFLKVNRISKSEAELLYSRILFPSVFIDAFLEKDFDFINNVFQDTSRYEEFIKKTYEILNSYVPINHINWIKDLHL